MPDIVKFCRNPRLDNVGFYGMYLEKVSLRKSLLRIIRQKQSNLEMEYKLLQTQNSYR